MVAGLKRDPILLLCMDGEDLLEFIKSPTFELEMLSLYFELELPDRSLKDYIIKTFEKLTIDQGKPPASDSWVVHLFFLAAYIQSNYNNFTLLDHINLVTCKT